MTTEPVSIVIECCIGECDHELVFSVTNSNLRTPEDVMAVPVIKVVIGTALLTDKWIMLENNEYMCERCAKRMKELEPDINLVQIAIDSAKLITTTWLNDVADIDKVREEALQEVFGNLRGQYK